MYHFQPLKLYIYACTSGVYLHIKIVFYKSVFELEWSRLSCYHVAAPLIRSYSYWWWGGQIIKPSDWNMKQLQLAHKWTSRESISEFEPDWANKPLIYPQVTEMWADGCGDDRGARRTTQGPNQGNWSTPRSTGAPLTHQRRLTMQPPDPPGESVLGNEERTWTKGHKLDFNCGNRWFPFFSFFKQQEKR